MPALTLVEREEISRGYCGRSIRYDRWPGFWPLSSTGGRAHTRSLGWQAWGSARQIARTRPAVLDCPPLERIGIAVSDQLKHQRTDIKGSSRRHLRRLFRQLGTVDLFIHDSLHSEHNVRFEADQAWAFMRLGGAIVIDDIDANRGFRTLTEVFSGHQSMICEAEPLRPDLRRLNGKGLFGIILKRTALQTNVGTRSPSEGRLPSRMPHLSIHRTSNCHEGRDELIFGVVQVIGFAS